MCDLHLCESCCGFGSGHSRPVFLSYASSSCLWRQARMGENTDRRSEETQRYEAWGGDEEEYGGGGGGVRRAWWHYLQGPRQLLCISLTIVWIALAGGKSISLFWNTEKIERQLDFSCYFEDVSPLVQNTSVLKQEWMRVKMCSR